MPEDSRRLSASVRQTAIPIDSPIRTTSSSRGPPSARRARRRCSSARRRAAHHDILRSLYENSADGRRRRRRGWPVRRGGGCPWPWGRPRGLLAVGRRPGGLDAALLVEVLSAHILDPPPRVTHTRRISGRDSAPSVAGERSRVPRPAARRRHRPYRSTSRRASGPGTPSGGAASCAQRRRTRRATGPLPSNRADGGRATGASRFSTTPRSSSSSSGSRSVRTRARA